MSLDGSLSICAHDSGSMTGCRPACDQPATRTLTYEGYRGPYVTRLCDQHADHLPTRVHPHRVIGDEPIRDQPRPDWRTMTRDVFDHYAPTTQTMLTGMPVRDACGTGDLFTLLDN
jgi:hypothetical protein